MKIDVGSHRVSEARLIISAATTFSLVSVSVCLLTIPRLYREINILYEEVRADVAQFRVETDAAWSALMDIHQTVVIRPVEIRIVEEKEDFEREQNNPFESFVRRRKREEASGGPSKLPPWCKCEPLRPNCSPGPPGPEGLEGEPGLPGETGEPGEDNSIVYPEVNCPLPDTKKCIKCAAGPRGPPGSPGPQGYPGAEGKVGIAGPMGKPGAEGPPGESGDAGPDGAVGVDGPPGNAGISTENSATVFPGRKGADGPPGPAGFEGPPGELGDSGLRGIRGPMGKMGPSGKVGERGPEGPNGAEGLPGLDAAYCPCPSRFNEI